MGRRVPLAVAGVFALVVAVIAVVMVTSGGGEDSSGPVTGSGSAESALPVDVLVDVGVAEVAAPDPAALIVDGSGTVVPGDQVLVRPASRVGPCRGRAGGGNCWW